MAWLLRSRYGPAMSRSAGAGRSPSPVTADDLDLAVRLAVAVLREAPSDAWDAKAGSLEWDCWETVEHLSDDLFAYAAQLGPKTPPLDGEVPFVWESRRPGGPANAIHANREAGPAGLLQVLEASGALLVSMVRTTPPRTRADTAADPHTPRLRRLRPRGLRRHGSRGDPGTHARPDARTRARLEPTRRPVRASARPAVPGCARIHRSLAHPVVGHRTRRTARTPSADHLAMGRNTPSLGAGVSRDSVHGGSWRHVRRVR